MFGDTFSTKRAQKLRSKDPTASQTVQTKNPKTMITVHNLDQVLSLAVLGDMVYYLLVFGMILATMMMMESFVSCSFKEPLGMAGDMVFWVNCGLCGVWVHTYCAFQKNAISRNIYARNVHLNFFYGT